MNQFFRKMKSLKYILLTNPRPLKTAFNSFKENIREYRVKLSFNDLFTYKTQLNFKFVCIPESSTSVHFYVHNQNYDEVELKIAKNWIDEGDFCIDIGANIGYFCTLFAKQVGSRGKVIAVEASPQTFKYLRQAIQTLSLEQIYLEEVCITDKDGFVEFMVSCDNSSDVKQSLTVNPKDKHLFKKEMVNCTTINCLIEKHKLNKNVSLVKMDIEGSEPLALSGSRLLFQEEALPLFIVEVYQMGLSRLGFESKDVLRFFSPDLFDLYYINRSYPNPTPEFEYGVIYPISNTDTYSWYWHTNIIAIPKMGKYANRKMKIQAYLP